MLTTGRCIIADTGDAFSGQQRILYMLRSCWFNLYLTCPYCVNVEELSRNLMSISAKYLNKRLEKLTSYFRDCHGSYVSLFGFNAQINKKQDLHI